MGQATSDLLSCNGASQYQQCVVVALLLISAGVLILGLPQWKQAHGGGWLPAESKLSNGSGRQAEADLAGSPCLCWPSAGSKLSNGGGRLANRVLP